METQWWIQKGFTEEVTPKEATQCQRPEQALEPKGLGLSPAPATHWLCKLGKLFCLWPLNSSFIKWMTKECLLNNHLSYKLTPQGLSLEHAPRPGSRTTCFFTNLILLWDTIGFKAKPQHQSLIYWSGSSSGWKDHSFSPGPWMCLSPSLLFPT